MVRNTEVFLHFGSVASWPLKRRIDEAVVVVVVVVEVSCLSFDDDGSTWLAT